MSAVYQGDSAASAETHGNGTFYYSVYWLYWYKSANTDGASASATAHFGNKSGNGIRMLTYADVC
jgi:hypothetical protein